MRFNPRSTLRNPELLLLTGLALLTRFWGLFDPRAVVWDEVHFQGYAGAYFSGAYYVDVHPPLGKLLLAGAAKLLGVSGAALAAHEPTPVLRILPALAGALIIPVVYVILRQLTTGRRVATLGAALLLLDNALLVESRFILMDSMLILFGMATVMLYLEARRREGIPRWAWLAATGVAAGLAVSVKWTGLSALGLVMLAWGAEAIFRRRNLRLLVRECFVLVALPAVIYVASFAVHFALLKNTGRGAGWMTPQFQSTLAGNRLYRPDARAPFFSSFVHLNRVMSDINIGWATDKNPGASPWYTWPISKHSMTFWSSSPTADGTQGLIVLFGNPVVWWGILIGAAATLIGLVRRNAALHRQRIALAFLAAGYAFNFAPFALIQRPMYLYHYFFGLIFSLMFAAVGVGALAGWIGDDAEALWRFRSASSRALYLGVIGLAAGSFLYLAPMSLGRPLSESAVLHRRWILERHVTLGGR